MDSDGITRACTMVPVISRKASATQIHEISSRIRRLRNETGSCPGSCVMSVGLFYGGRFVVRSVFVGETGGVFAGRFGSVGDNWERAAFADFELQTFRWINARVAGRTEIAMRIVDGDSQAVQ